MIGAQTNLTPTQAEAVAKRRLFRAKIASRAVPDAGILLKAPRIDPDLIPKPTDMQRWRKRQEQAHSTPRVWFEIVEELNIRPPTILEIQQQVADYFEVRRTEIVSTRRAAYLVLPRHISFYLCRKLTPCGFPMIAKHCGRRDHTTAIHAYQKIAGMVERGDKELIGHIQAIKTLIERRRS